MTSLSRTYNINVNRILSRRRGAFDLEDVYLWFHEYLKDDPRWQERACVSHPRVTISDSAYCSTIQIDAPRIDLLNEKQNFVEICRGEKWTPPAIILSLAKRTKSTLTQQSRRQIFHFESWLKQAGSPRLLFLKKAGPGIGGGFDVNAIVIRETSEDSPSLEDRVVALIEKQNQSSRYSREIFVLQAGVEHPLLTPAGQKLDLRLYMLVVGDSEGLMAFYSCRVGDVRNTSAGPYSATSEDSRLQVTNVSQNKSAAGSFAEITRVFSPETAPDWYDTVFSQFLVISQRIGIIYSPLLRSETPTRNLPFVSLVGLDAVVDENSLRPMIVELNRRPTVYTPEEAREMGYSSALFMRDVFELGIRAQSDGTVGRSPSPDSQFVLVHLDNSRRLTMK